MKHRQNILPHLILMVLLLASCSNTKTTNVNQDSFLFPDIADTLTPAESYYSPFEITIPNHFIKTIQKFGNKANLLDTTSYYEFFIDGDYLSDTEYNSVKNRKGLLIYVDTTREVSVDLNERAIPPFPSFFLSDGNRSKTQKLIDSVSFVAKLEAWKANRMLVKGFAVYIYNPTNDTVRLEEQDGRIMIIQEALDTNGQWKPIEVWQFNTCGNSYAGVILQPNYYLMIKTIKYKGTYETLLRLKMMNKNEIVYSKPFRGSINLSQTNTSSFNGKYRPIDFFNLDK